MSSNKQSDGTYWQIAFPITAETRKLIEEAVFAKYRKIIGERKAS
jgi:DNA-binding cell septation regulator SpoVG